MANKLYNPIFRGGTVVKKAVSFGDGTVVRKPIVKVSGPKAIRASIVKGTVATRGGDYPVYEKGSAAGMSFRKAFAGARAAGKKEFTWEGRKYSTKKR